MPAGRPTDYNPKFVKIIDNYIKEALDVSFLPTMQGLALCLNVNGDTLVEWGKKYPKFSAALTRLMNNQAVMLMNKGLTNEYNPTIAKLILSSNHGMKERADVTTNNKDLPQPLLGGLAKDSV